MHGRFPNFQPVAFDSALGRGHIQGNLRPGRLDSGRSDERLRFLLPGGEKGSEAGILANQFTDEREAPGKRPARNQRQRHSGRTFAPDTNRESVGHAGHVMEQGEGEDQGGVPLRNRRTNSPDCNPIGRIGHDLTGHLIPATAIKGQHLRIEAVKGKGVEYGRWSGEGKTCQNVGLQKTGRCGNGKAVGIRNRAPQDERKTAGGKRKDGFGGPTGDGGRENKGRTIRPGELWRDLAVADDEFRLPHRPFATPVERRHEMAVLGPNPDGPWTVV